jgi:gluconate 2-dehydrogenase alpha chain
VLGSFLPGNGVGGAGVHWNGHTWRALPEELRLRSYVTEKFGAKTIDEGMTIEDWGVSYDELEPHFDRFEYVCGISGRAGNIGGQTQAGGNRSRGRASAPTRCRRCPRCSTARCSARRPRPWAPPVSAAFGQLSDAYTNEYGMQLGRATSAALRTLRLHQLLQVVAADLHPGRAQAQAQLQLPHAPRSSAWSWRPTGRPPPA